MAAPMACSGGGGTPGVELTEARVDIDEDDHVNGVVAWEDGFVAVTSRGVVFRSRDGERWATVETTGLDAGDDETVVRTDLAGVTAGDGYLLAAGTRSVRNGDGEDDAVFVPLVWRSDDGEHWQQVETEGLTARSLDTVVAHDGAFLAFGTEEIPRPPDLEPTDEQEESGELPATIPVSSTWRSEDGAAWEQVGANLTPPGENAYEDIAAVATQGDDRLASLGVECSGCYDDYAFVLSKSDDAGDTWRELEEHGLDDIRLANTDVIPRVVSFDGEFVAVGTSGADDTTATLWRSTDGVRWTDKTRLGGPEIPEYAESIDAIAATDTGVIVLELMGDRLVVWHVELE
jgi:hypothetical protein